MVRKNILRASKVEQKIEKNSFENATKNGAANFFFFFGEVAPVKPCHIFVFANLCFRIHCL
jgi:hypothetical protein